MEKGKQKKRKKNDSDDDEPSRKIIKHYSSQEEILQSSSKGDCSKNKEEGKNGEAEEKQLQNFSSIVATHYNSVKTGLERRKNSRILYLRNFNNWIKGLLITESTRDLSPNAYSRNLTVLDMCCGKGGDLFKWTRLNVRYVVCTDIAEVSLKEYESRYNNYLSKCRSSRKYCNMKCEFIPADCTRERLKGKYHDPSIQFDIVSCQFSFHYCFESLPQAECMLKNASECLKRGGFFMGTIPNSNEIIKRLKQSGTNNFGNEAFSLTMHCQEPYPLFGAKYDFHLGDVVNCPEFLVHFPTFEKLAARFGLELVKTETFPELFDRGSKTCEGELLLKKIGALEIYPAPEGRKLIGPLADYQHAETFCERENVQQVGTLSKTEWDIASLYRTFVFRKVAQPN